MTIPPYDPKNVFARILRKELPASIVYEDNHVLAFHDLHPAAPVHVLVIPKKPVRCLSDLLAEPDTDIAAFWTSVRTVLKKLNLTQGHRIIMNEGLHGNQEVPHMHAHILAGKPLGAILA